MEYLPLSFLAGILTILAPCVLPLLPVIIGGSVSETNDKKRPLIITLSLAASIVVFTLLLKASTLLIDIPQDFWKWFAATIVFLFAVSLLFPNAWPTLSLWFGKVTGQTESVEHKSQKVLFKFYKKKGFWAAVVLGAALGPVFASCSPTYFLILGTVLPASFFVGVLNLIAYSIGLALVMFLISYAGQRFTKTLNLAADPKGWFKRALGILFLVVAIAIATGYDKKFSTYLLDQGLFDVTKVEQNILDKRDTQEPMNTDAQEIDIFNTNVKAPELAGLTHWINSEGYDSIEELRGKVVLIDFWTYSCINCIRTLPYIQKWHEQYADDGLVILGIHAPEFAFERKAENVKDAVNDYGLTYPVAQDNDFATWRNYENHYWPAKYLIDKNGRVRYYHFGEGEYDVTEQAITQLLGTDMMDSDVEVKSYGSNRDLRTRETYLGTARRENFLGIDAKTIGSNEWTISGGWDEDGEKIFADSLPVSLTMKFHAAEANLVMNGTATAEIIVDGEFYKTITIDGARLYNIFEDLGTYAEHEVTITFTGEYIEAFAWTFG
ncbi:cytochrome c biogenesis protein DipZ [Patescibacteria group bacterium]|nr:cytochrome c biogenesis protein DipZ [Patescibacteria group bacterium]